MKNLNAKKFLKDKERGVGSLGTLLFILIVVIGVFVGFRVIPFYYSFYEIQGLMQAQADKGSELTDKDIRRNLVEAIKKLNIPVENPEERLKINRYNNRMVIELFYEEVLYVDFGNGYDYDLWVFEFNPRGER